MIDEILGGIFGELIFGRLEKSKRTELLIRLFFGLLLAGLAATGVIHFARMPDPASPMRICIIAMFFFLSAFGLLNVALARKWKWPGIMFIISFVAMFVIRIALGP